MFTDEIHAPGGGRDRAAPSPEGTSEERERLAGSGGGLRHVLSGLGAIGLMVGMTATGAAQLPRIGVPRGQLRLEIGSAFNVANASLYGGESRALFLDGDVGTALDRNLAAPESLVRLITADGSYRLSAGRSSVRGSTQVGSGILSAALGLTGRITLFGTLPIVRGRSQVQLAVDSTGANVGPNPGATPTNAFLAAFQTALNTLQTKINNGDYVGAQLTLAQQTLADGTALRAQFAALYSGSPFVPLATSDAGVAMAAVVASLQTTLSTGLNVPGFSTAPAFATGVADGDDLRTYLTGGAVGASFRGDQVIQRPGDLALGAVYTAFERPAFRLALTGLVRLPTGAVDREDDLFDLGTGDGQTDIEGRVDADVTHWRLGARVSAGYNRQLSHQYERRADGYFTPIAGAASLTLVDADPGDELTLGIEPFFRLAPGFAVTTGLFRWTHGEDLVTRVSDGVSLGSAAVTGERTTTALQAGLSYSSFAGVMDGKGTPMEARFYFREVVSATGARVDKTRSVGMQVRAYYRLW